MNPLSILNEMHLFKLTSHRHLSLIGSGKRGVERTLRSILLLFLATHSLYSRDHPKTGLTLQGVCLIDTSRTRFIFRGVNMEMFRDPGCREISELEYSVRHAIARQMKSVGINAVRVNYSASFLNSKPENIGLLLDVMEALAKEGLYVMPSDHSFTGKRLTGFTESLPIFRQIIEGMKQRGFASSLLINPYNEPGPDVTSDEWVNINITTLDYLRHTSGFNGLVVLDTTAWATSTDARAIQTVMAHDATLCGGHPLVVFSHHWYPNHSLTKIEATTTLASKIPLMIGEIGQLNPGASSLKPEFVRQVIRHVNQEGLPRGHNGIFGWIWNWCDENSMTQKDFLTLKPFGKLFFEALFQEIRD